MRALAAGLEPRGARAAAMDVDAPVLTVVGSAAQVSRAQFETLVSEPGVTALTVPPRALRLGAGAAEARDIGRALDAALASGDDVALAIGPEPGIDLRQGSGLAAELAALVAPRLPKLGGVVMTGGETARAVLVAAGIRGLRLRSEVEPGVPLGVGIGAFEIPVVTKAGAFGDCHTLLRCRAALRRGRGVAPDAVAAASNRIGR
jgi:uncharacterized protein YgbK (DUF1537 family)